MKQKPIHQLYFIQKYTSDKASSISIFLGGKLRKLNDWKMSRHQGPGPIPDRWLYCPRNANAFVAEKFLAFKTPLSDRFTSQMPMECQFLPEMVFSYAKMFKVR